MKAGFCTLQRLAFFVFVGTTHCMSNPYDAYIPFVLMGWHVNHGKTVEPTHITDIAPTICAMLHIQMPGS